MRKVTKFEIQQTEEHACVAWCQDTSDLRHFGTGAEVSVRHFGTSAEVSGHFGRQTDGPRAMAGTADA